MTLKQKIKKFRLNLRDLGHRITGNDKVIEEFYEITQSICLEHDALPPCERKAKLQAAVDRMTVDFNIPIPGRSKSDDMAIGGDYNPYENPVSENRKRVEMGRRYIAELGVKKR